MTILQDYKLIFNNKLKFNFNGGKLTSVSGQEFLYKMGYLEIIESLFVI